MGKNKGALNSNMHDGQWGLQFHTSKGILINGVSSLQFWLSAP